MLQTHLRERFLCSNRVVLKLFCAIALLRYFANRHRPLAPISLCSNKSRKSEQCSQMFKGLYVRRRPISAQNQVKTKKGLHVRTRPILRPKIKWRPKKGQHVSWVIPPFRRFRPLSPLFRFSPPGVSLLTPRERYRPLWEPLLCHKLTCRNNSLTPLAVLVLQTHLREWPSLCSAGFSSTAITS